VTVIFGERDIGSHGVTGGLLYIYCISDLTRVGFEFTNRLFGG